MAGRTELLQGRAETTPMVFKTWFWKMFFNGCSWMLAGVRWPASIGLGNRGPNKGRSKTVPKITGRCICGDVEETSDGTGGMHGARPISEVCGCTAEAAGVDSGRRDVSSL